jgi:hypothetical protein
MKYRYKGRREFEANGYTFRPNEITEIPEEDSATLRKLATHPSFQKVE